MLGNTTGNLNFFFPEEFYMPEKSLEQYSQRVSKGLSYSACSSALIISCVRDCSNILERNLLCLEYTRSFFKNSHCFIYENDSKDSTKSILREYTFRHKSKILCENINTKRQNGTDIDRRIRMANVRNRCLKYAKSINKREKVDVVIVVDLDLLGAWSYTGLLNSLSYMQENNNTCFGSNSLYYNSGERLFFDTWAYRSMINHEVGNNFLRFERGQNPISVESCFGGLMLYPGSILKHDIRYTEDDCDHVTLHNQLRNYDYEIFLNPSQITLYNKHYYV